MANCYTTKSALKERRAEAQQREADRIAQRRAELEGNSFAAIRDKEVRPLSEAKRALDENFKALVRTLRTNVLEVPEEFDVQDPEPLGYINVLDVGAVKTQNQLAYEQFKLMHPEGSACPWYRCDENVRAIETYFSVNGIKVQTADMLSKAWCRLSALGLTEQKPAPVAEKKLIYAPLPTREGEDGFDLITGEPTFLSARLVDNLSADDYRRFKKGLAVDPRLIFHRP
jgi:hypothetical protein